MAELAESTLTEPAWLEARREQARELVSTLDLPTKKSKGWEFTDLRKLKLDAYESAPADVSVTGGEDGAVVLPLAEALAEHGELLEDRLGRLVTQRDPFIARNDAEWHDGVLVYVPRNTVVKDPIRVELNLDESGQAVYWRTLVVLEEGAQAEVWENYVSADDEVASLLNTVVEVAVGPAANLHYVSTQDLSEKSWLFSAQRGEVDRDGTLDWAALGFGGTSGKVRMTTRLIGNGSTAKVTGGYAGGGRQHLDYDTLQEHAALNTVSDLAFRGVLTDRATAVWRGMIDVEEGAQQTDAFQECRNMLLSPKAHADAIPGLEIAADDVACTHAAAIAQVDPEQVFYLSSRGLPKEKARNLVIGGFLESLVERLGHGTVREEIAEKLEQRLAEIL
ncbi:MAG: Fe-S cluster assembly protein SufD [Solirubrobacterales bacterium]|nr:Fe-S cluster assembly protein SufD [Solirubrobacterales bacterium]